MMGEYTYQPVNVPLPARPRQRPNAHYACSQAPSRGRLRSGMAKLIYVANVSLDGYIEDAHGSFEWTAPIDEVFTFITDLVRLVGTLFRVSLQGDP